MARAALILGIALSLVACRKAKGPSPLYEKASRQYQQLYATELDEAYGDPQMDQIITSLKLVDRNSINAPDAERLLGTIERGKEELAKQREVRTRAAAAAEANALKPTNIDPQQVLQAYAVDAGPAQDPYGVGASIAQLNIDSGGCLAGEEPFNETGTGKTGTVYRLASPLCNEKLPGFVGQSLLVVDGKIYRRLSQVELPRPAPAPVAPPAPVDAGAQAAAPQARAPQAAEPVDAGEPAQIYPGQPVPEGMVVASPEEPDAGF